MKIHLICLAMILSLFCTALTNAQTPGKVVVPPETILKNLSTLLDYYSSHLRLRQGFIAYDTRGHRINAGKFLQRVATGNYLPLQVSSADNAWAYRLYKLNAHADHDVRFMLSQIGNTCYGIYETEGKPFPKFHYVDLNGKTFTSENTKGKIVVIKAWFIGCHPCVEEMPMLNKLTEKYRDRKDIIFLSLAFDSKKALKDFLKHRTFKYATVPVKATYIQDQLHVTGYPAHWVINKQGVVVNMSYDHTEMIAALSREALKK